VKKINILLICSAGMSTNILIRRITASGEKKGFKVDIAAVSAQQTDSFLENQKPDVKPDVILIAPQTKYLEQGYKNKYSSHSAVEVINIQDYGNMNGDAIFNRAEKLASESLG
jgi:PTS system cellobiose-specific IIB component